MKVVRVELGKRLQPCHVRDVNLLAVPVDQPLGPEFLKHSVRVNGSDAQRVAQVPLCDRELEAVLTRAANRLQAHQQFAQEMRNLRVSRTLAHADKPLSQDALINQCRPP